MSATTSAMASGSSPGLGNVYIPPDSNTRQLNWAGSADAVPQTVDGSYAGRRVPEWMDPLNGELSILVMVPALEQGTLPDNPWLVRKSIENSVGSIEDARPENRGARYVLKVRQVKQVQQLLNLRELTDGTKVKIDFHQTLNIRKCTVSCPYGLSMSDNELLEELRSQRVIEVKRFLRRDPKNRDNLLPTPTCLISVQGTTLPEFFYFGYVRVKTRAYYPNPLQCGKCYRFGHTKRVCQEGAICPECSHEHEYKPPCLAEAHCVNCKGPHSARARECPIKMAESKIVRIKIDEDVSYPEARKRYEVRQQQSTVQHRLETPKGAELLKMLELKDQEIANLRRLLEKLINEVAELKKERTAQPKNSTRTGSTQEAASHIEEGNQPDGSQIIVTEVRQDSKTTKRRQTNYNPTSPNGNRLAPPPKKLLENGKDRTNNELLTPPNDKKEFYRTDISPERDMDTDQV